jgi:hypothetical protein
MCRITQAKAGRAHFLLLVCHPLHSGSAPECLAQLRHQHSLDCMHHAGTGGHIHPKGSPDAGLAEHHEAALGGLDCEEATTQGIETHLQLTDWLVTCTFMWCTKAATAPQAMELAGWQLHCHAFTVGPCAVSAYQLLFRHIGRQVDTHDDVLKEHLPQGLLIKPATGGPIADSQTAHMITIAQYSQRQRSTCVRVKVLPAYLSSGTSFAAASQALLVGAKKVRAVSGSVSAASMPAASES